MSAVGVADLPEEEFSQHDQWWKSSVVYQIYPRSFADSNGDGVGDLAGITSRLDYLSWLGVDVIWLSPVYPSPQEDNGYDISDYQDIDPLFGSLAEFDALLGAVHSRGMKLILDLVVNHTSDEHPWFIESRASTNNARRDWYWWRPPRPGAAAGEPGAEPTNWGSVFSGSTWSLDETTGEYYLHLFSPKQPDLNWENPEVRQAMYSMMRWWLDRGVDGFRMDVINMISKNPALPDGRVLGADRHGDGGPYFICGPRIHEFLQEMNREVLADRPKPLLTVGEMPGVTVGEAVLFTQPARREVDMVFQFEHVQLDHGATKWQERRPRLAELKASLSRWQIGLAQHGWNSLYLSNHDQPRAVSRFGEDGEHRARSAKLLATVLHLHRGTPYIYQGEELGMANAPLANIEEFRDIESLNHYVDSVAAGSDPEAVLAALRRMSRDNARTPMQWDDSPHAGFTATTPWISVNQDYRTVNVQAERRDKNSVLQHYRKLIHLRRSEPAVVHGDYTILLPDHDQLYVFLRHLDDVELLIAANFSDGHVTATTPELTSWETFDVLISNYDRPRPIASGLTMRPWEVLVVRRTCDS